MILETDEENLGPEIFVQSVLGLHNCQIITRRNHATVEDNEIIFSGGQNNPLPTAGRAQQERHSSRQTEKTAKKKLYLGHPDCGQFTNNYGHWCFYSTKPALLGSFIFRSSG
jgi:hypothetical protein